MNYLKNILLLMIMTITQINTIPARSPLVSKQISDEAALFADKPNSDLYWQALAYIAKNNKDAAHKMVAAIQSNEPMVIDSQKYLTDIDAFFDHLFLTMVAHDPQLLTFLGLFESIGIREHNAFLNNVTPEALLQDFAQKKKNLETLKKFSFDALTQEQQISYKLFLWYLNHQMRGQEFIFHNYKIDQMNGILADLTYLFTQFHTLETQEDVENYIKRLNKIPDQLDQAVALVDHQRKLGIIVPAFAIQRVIASIKKMLEPAAKDHIFYSHLQKQIEQINPSNKQDILDGAHAIIEQKVYPAYQKLQTYFEKLATQVTDNNGAWALPNGDSYYAHTLERHTTTNLTADQIHELGLQEVAQIHQQMREIFAREKMDDASKSVGQLVQELAKDERFYFPETEEGRQQCLAKFEAIAERARKELYPLFDIKPEAKLKILPVPKHEQEGQPGAYYAPPSINGSRPGIFFANLRNMHEMPMYHMETLTVHEAEPGHHFQIALQQEMDIPVLRKLGDYNVFYEGWALYTEKLAYEQGFYSSSFAQLGHLGDELFRAARLVVDTGIHHKRWSREQAIDYMVQVTGMPKSSAATEIERYFVYPGQACSYKIGQLKLLELRKRMKDALGNKFDIRAFHNIVLKLGAAPLTILEEVVDNYIKQKLAE